MKKFFLFALVFFLVLFNYKVEKIYTPYLEKSSFVWEILKNKRPNQKNIDLLILGDSQILSGVHPKLLEIAATQKRKFLTYFYYPRPSEQLEGIYHFLLRYVETKKIQPKLVVWNLSPIHFTKNGLMDSNKKLFQEREVFTHYVILNSNIRNFYFPKEIDVLRYVLMNIFPFIKVSSLLNSEFGFIPNSLNLNLQSQNLKEYLAHNPFESLEKNFKRNQKILQSMQENFGYVDWNLEENTEQIECFQSSFRVPSEARLAYSIPRNSAYETLKKIVILLKEKNISFQILQIPFSPSSEKIFKNDSLESPFGKILLQWEKDFPNEKWLILNLEEKEYGDYVHPNFCGAKKITQYLLEVILQKEF